MRVTNSMIANNMLRNLSRNLGRMEKIQQQMASGKKFSRPSDDPIGVSRSLRLNTEIAAMNQYKRNADDTLSWLETTEMAINNIISVLQRANELVVQAASETNSIEERDAIKDEIRELKNQIIQIANTSYAGSYIFSGFKTDKPLLKDDGTYDLGEGTASLTLDETIDINIGLRDRISINSIGQRIFGLYSADDGDSPLMPYILEGAKTDLSAKPIDASAPGGLNFTITNGTDTQVVNIQGVYNDLNALAADIKSALAGTPFEEPAVSIYVRNNKLVFESSTVLTIKSGTSNPADPVFEVTLMGIRDNQDSISAEAYNLDILTEETLMLQQSLKGRYVDLAAKPIDASAPGGLNFTITNGTDTQVVNIQGVYNDLNALAADIKNALAGTPFEEPAVSIYVSNNRLVFESNTVLTIKSGTSNPADPVFDVTLMGISNNQTSVSRVDSGDKSQLIAIFDQLIKDLESDNTEGISRAMTRIGNQLSSIGAVRSEIGVKSNRVELTLNRIEDDILNLKELLSKNEDADMAEVIMNMKMEENVYQASLATGARIIQPSLIDFLR